MNVCMVAYTFYENDNRVRRYAETLAERGDHVEVVALKSPGEGSTSTIRGVQVYKIQERTINEKGKLTYLYRLVKFLIKSFIFITLRHIKNPYQLVHVHSVPDFEVFAALVPKLGGAKIILDVHDIVPEFFASKFHAKDNSLVFKALVLVEKISCCFADHVIISNDIWYQKITSRSVAKHKCISIINYPDASIFYPRKKEKPNNHPYMLYPGSLNWHQGLDIAIKAFAMIKDEIPDLKFFIYGKGPAEPELRSLISELNLSDRVIMKDPLPVEEIAEIMAQADLGVIPKRNDPFGGDAFSTKSLEFMSLGVPIIISATRIDKYYFDDSVVKFFEPENEKEMNIAIIKIINDMNFTNSLIKNAGNFVQKNCWDIKRHMYIEIVEKISQKNIFLR